MYLPLLLASLCLLASSQAIIIYGPLLPNVFTDPSIIYHDSTYYAFASRYHNTTSKKTIHTPIATSKFFNSGWSLLAGKDALPETGQWTNHSATHVLAPDINQLPDGSFILYYTSHPKGYPNPHKTRLIGAAKSKNILGPYKPDKKSLLDNGKSVRGELTSGPNVLSYNNEEYVIFKNGSAHDNERTSYLDIVKFKKDGTKQLTKWTNVLNSTAADGHDIGDPCLVTNPNPAADGAGRFVLIFTTKTHNSTTQHIEYATAKAVFGPYTRRGKLLGGGTYGDVNITAPFGLDVVSRNVSQALFSAWDGESFEDGKKKETIYAVELRYSGVDVTVV